MPNAVARSLSAHASPYPEISVQAFFQHFQFLTRALPTIACVGFAGSAFSLLMLQDNLGEFPAGRTRL